MQTLDRQNIGLIGGGAMGDALVGGLLAAGHPKGQIRVAEVDPARRKQLEKTRGVATESDGAPVVAESDVVLLAVKPGVIRPVLESLTGSGLLERPLWISIAAGVTLAGLEAPLPAGARIVRAMPNTPALVGAAATAICGNTHVSADDLGLARAVFESVGTCYAAPNEGLLDAVTGLSGSGPAYVFLFLEALGDAGVRMGLPRDAAYELAFQTVYGAAKLARGSQRSPAELRRQVSSPGGTTLAGLARLEAAGFTEAIGEAVAAATRRAGELGRGE